MTQAEMDLYATDRTCAICFRPVDAVDADFCSTHADWFRCADCLAPSMPPRRILADGRSVCARCQEYRARYHTAHNNEEGIA